MNEFECRYLFEDKTNVNYLQGGVIPFIPHDKVVNIINDYQKLFETEHLTNKCLYEDYYKIMQLKKDVHLTTSVRLNEAEFDSILQYTDNKPMCIYLHDQWFELDHFKFKNKYSRVYPKYEFPSSFEIECVLLDKQPITSN